MEKFTLVDKAQEKIKEMIIAEEYDVNGYLPSEGELSKKFFMSRVTIREAVRSMEVRGFVERIHGKGIKVSDNGVHVVTRSLEDMLSKEIDILDELLEMRILIEPKTAALAAERKDGKDIEKLRKFIDIMEKSIVMDDAYQSADLAFHVELARVSKNRIIYSLISAYTPILKELIIETTKAETPLEQQFHYHRNILSAIEAGDAKAASDAMKRHLKATDQNRNIKFGL